MLFKPSLQLLQCVLRLLLLLLTIIMTIISEGSTAVEKKNNKRD